jgi:eukaryotic-like serine/threonine-protein kinase
MTPATWSEIERLFHEALARAPEDRATFVAHACRGNADLQNAVASLLDYEPHTRDFIEPRTGDLRASPMADAVAAVRTPITRGRHAGSVFGAYALESLIATGGMGEVYRARDTRLDRVVAIKILPPHFADDRDRRDRFQREARIVSSLNHPHICALYDVGLHEGVQYLVMEHVEGETLQERIGRGPIPVADACGALIQVADALDKAHRRGVVHRDLKPGNIMWTKSGVKLLDFGLAARGPSGGVDRDHLLSTEPWRTLTAEGTIMGTVQYMAPEQLQGLPVDARTDIFAFGAVGYEMLTAKRAFEGNSQAALIGAILKDEPQPIADVLGGIPPLLGRTLSRCLAKDPDDRWQSASDLSFQLRSLASPSDTAIPPPRRARSPWLERGLWIGAAVAALTIGALRPAPQAPQPQQVMGRLAPVVFPISPSQGGSLSAFFTPFAISPDAKYLVYVVARDDGVRHLGLRSLDSSEDRVLPGTEGGSTPFWSPDSQWIGFFAANSLKKLRVTTGVTQTVAGNVTTRGGATWGIHDDIVFAGLLRGLSRVSAGGGQVARVAAVDPDNPFSPQFLSDGLHVIYSVPARSAIGLARLDGGPSRTLMTLDAGTSEVRYSRGHVFFVQDGTLFARSFNEERLEFTGAAQRLVDGIPSGLPARTPFSVSAAGVLVYWTNPLGVPAVLRWFERNGQSSTAVATPAIYRGFTLSPDGRRIIGSRIAKTGGEDLWLHNLDGGTDKQITFDSGAFMPWWSPDGTRIAYSGFSVHPPPKPYIKDLRVEGAPSSVDESPLAAFASSWTPDSREIVIVRPPNPSSLTDLWRHRVDGGASEPLWFNTPANEMQGTVSPDGRWIAYVTDQSGRLEVCIASYPTDGFKQQVSLGGGEFPQWAESELFFLSPDRRVMAARVTAGAAGVQIATPQALFAVPHLVDTDPLRAAAAHPYVAARDGRRFLVAERARDPNAPPLTVLVNWPAVLNR